MSDLEVVIGRHGRRVTRKGTNVMNASFTITEDHAFPEPNIACKTRRVHTMLEFDHKAEMESQHRPLHVQRSHGHVGRTKWVRAGHWNPRLVTKLRRVWDVRGLCSVFAWFVFQLSEGHSYHSIPTASHERICSSDCGRNG